MNIGEREAAVRRRRSVGWTRFTVAQAVSAIIGLILVIIGGVAMARVGFTSLTGETTTVAAMDHTLALSIVHLVVGLIFLTAATSMFGARSTLIGMGILAVAFGAIVLIEPSPFVDFLGEGRPLGGFYLVIGLISLAAGLISPTYVAEHASFEDETVDETTPLT